MVVYGKLRFTILTDQLIRIEYDQNQKFEDRATIAIINRNLKLTKFQSSFEKNILKITTEKLQIEYDTTYNGLQQNSLKIKGLGKEDLDFKDQWQIGQVDNGNLFGTIRALETIYLLTLNCSYQLKQDDEDSHCSEGIISKDGWVVLEDSNNFILGEDDWWQGQNGNFRDLYFFGHGKNYKQAMFDFKQIAGTVPLMPRYSLGVMWTRWLDYDQKGIKKVINTFKNYKIPIDVCILDMNWHRKNDWGSYSFDDNLYPNYTQLLNWLHGNEIKVGINIHDKNGINSYDNFFKEMCIALNLDPNKINHIPLQICSSKNYAFKLEDIMISPLKAEGVDFLWSDWESGGSHAGCQGFELNPQIWFNKLRVTDDKRKNPQSSNSSLKRQINMGRWGGLGNHRYQFGFTGDIPLLTWDFLQQQPYFSATAANVAFAYWSHDITALGFEMEMYVRWIQWGSFSGIMRFHERGLSSGDCSKYIFPDQPGGFPEKICAQWAPFDSPYLITDIIRNVVQLREHLIPYIYQGAWQLYQLGVAMVRPLYYDFPNEEMSYKALSLNGKMSQYMFGNNIMIAPIVAPKHSSNLSKQELWIPPGQWYEFNTGELIQGPKNIIKNWDLSQIPMFIRDCSILPTRLDQNYLDKFKIAQSKDDFQSLQFEVFPCSKQIQNNNSIQVFEDDGITLSYLDEFYTIINATLVQQNYSYINFLISVNSKKLWKTDNSRYFSIKFLNSFPPDQILLKINNQIDSQQIIQLIKPNIQESFGIWFYEAATLSYTIKLPKLQPEQFPIQVEIIQGEYAQYNKQLSAIKGALLFAQLAKNNLDQARMTPGSTTIGDYSFLKLNSFSAQLQLTVYKQDYKEFQKQIQIFPQLYQHSFEVINDLLKVPNQTQQQIERVQYSLELLKASQIYQFFQQQVFEHF